MGAARIVWDDLEDFLLLVRDETRSPDLNVISSMLVVSAVSEAKPFLVVTAGTGAVAVLPWSAFTSSLWLEPSVLRMSWTASLLQCVQMQKLDSWLAWDQILHPRSRTSRPLLWRTYSLRIWTLVWHSRRCWKISQLSDCTQANLRTSSASSMIRFDSSPPPFTLEAAWQRLTVLTSVCFRWFGNKALVTLLRSFE